MIPSAEESLMRLRNAGFMVAVHNDYRQNGALRTFWLLTHANGRFLKGEGDSDAEALWSIIGQALDAGHAV